jgi:hypothetical protein
MKILFLQGWDSVSGGVKPTYLIEHGYEVIDPALDGEFEGRMEKRDALWRPGASARSRLDPREASGQHQR